MRNFIQEMKNRGRWFIREVVWVTRVVVSSADRFYWDDGFSKAAALAYTSLLSLIPFTLVVFGTLASFAITKDSIPQIRNFVFSQIIDHPETLAKLEEVITYVTERLSDLNAVAIFFFVITSLLLLNSIEYALNGIWQVFEHRKIGHRIAIFSAIIVITPVLAATAYYFTKQRLEPLVADFGTTYAYSDALLNYLVPFVIDFALFLLFYYLVPKANVRFQSASFGAFIAAILFGFAKVAFALYVERFSSYDKLYGTLATVPILLLWLYCLWVILLYGAECCFQSQYLPRYGRIWKLTIWSIGDSRLLLAMQSLASITKSFINGDKLPSDVDLASELGCSSLILKGIIDDLERAEIVARGDGACSPLTLLRAADKISVADIADAVLRSKIDTRYSSQLASVYKTIGNRKQMESTTLAEILR